MAFGLDATGFTKKRLEDLKTEIEGDYQSAFANIDIDELGPAGQLIGIQSKLLADLWDLAEALYNSQYPTSASGVSLDNTSDLVGIQRLGATKSSVTASASGTEGTVIPAGRIIDVVDGGDRFISSSSATITKGNAIDLIIDVSNVIDSTLYTVTLNGNPYTYTSDGTATNLEIAAGLVLAITETGITATDNLDGTFNTTSDDVDVSFIATVDANLTIDLVTIALVMEAEVTGPSTALAGTLTEIITPVAGWSSVTNLNDAVVGRNTESDSALRIRRADSLQISGSATVEAIRASLREVDNVTDAFVLENRTLVVDGDGLPGKSFECVVAGGTEQDIADVIWREKPAGIETHGDIPKNVTDSQGDTQVINFSRATEIYTWVKVTRTFYTEETYPVDGDAQIAANVLAFGITHTIGLDVITQRFIGEVYKVPGLATVVVEVATSATEVGPPGAYSTANLPISNTEVATFDSTRISVV